MQPPAMPLDPGAVACRGRAALCTHHACMHACMFGGQSVRLACSPTALWSASHICLRLLHTPVCSLSLHQVPPRPSSSPARSACCARRGSRAPASPRTTGQSGCDTSASSCWRRAPAPRCAPATAWRRCAHAARCTACLATAMSLSPPALCCAALAACVTCCTARCGLWLTPAFAPRHASPRLLHNTGAPADGARAVCCRLCVLLGGAGPLQPGAAGAQPGGGARQPNNPARCAAASSVACCQRQHPPPHTHTHCIAAGVRSPCHAAWL